ncbi:MAG: NAD(P)-dependent oxidoreductase [Rhodospirillales bacterium]|nr:NAD(P)-dependent oxidoreductase [Rhodospirillales bacterium]
MKVLVTGGSGFLGSHVADALNERGHDVVLYDLKPSPFAGKKQQQIAGSVLDMEALGNAMKGSEAVYHLAAVADLDEAALTPLKTVEVNILGTANVLEQARINDVRRFVYASSIYVYSDHGSFYRTSKRAGELLVEDFRKQYGLTYTVLRFGSLYGPRADEHNSVFRMLDQALRERRIDYSGNGEEVREYIHVLDAAAAAADMLDAEYENESISLTGHQRMKTREMLEMINEMLGRGLTINYQPSTDDGHYVQTPYSYNPKLGKKLAREKHIDLGLGLLDCLQEIDKTRNGNEGDI